MTSETLHGTVTPFPRTKGARHPGALLRLLGSLPPALLFGLLALLWAGLWAGSAGAQHLRIYHVDVDQGDATLFVSPSGRTLLVDSGKNGHGPRIRAVMDEAGVASIDHFVATHYHEDHYGGIDDLVEAGVAVANAYDRGDKAFVPVSKRSQATFTDYEEAVGSGATHLMRGETIPLDPEMLVTCIASGGVVLGEEDPEPGSTENDLSVALLVQYGGFRYFVGGDIEHVTEEKIAARELVTDVDVYQANHHGSHTSSSRPFLDDLMPSVVVISNGDHGGYGHPRRSTLDRLDNLPSPPTVLQTNKYLSGGLGGNVPDRFIADLEATDADGTIRMEIDLTASAFEVSYRDTTLRFALKRPSPPAHDVVIERLLPDPAGDEWIEEAITLRNDGPAPVDMTGWLVQDAAGRVWTLGSLGSIAPGSSATIQRNGMPMGLNNGAEEVVLLDPQGEEQDRFGYEGTVEGVWMETGR